MPRPIPAECERLFAPSYVEYAHADVVGTTADPPGRTWWTYAAARTCEEGPVHAAVVLLARHLGVV